METLPPDDDGDFEVTVEMLIHDTMDDETTLAEEEATRTLEEDKAELDDLQEEGDMPLERLLALYGYAQPAAQEGEGKGEEEKEEEEKEGKREEENTTHSRKSDSGFSTRSRRRNRVVPLEPQKAVIHDSADSAPPVSPTPVNKTDATTTTDTGTNLDLSQLPTPADVNYGQTLARREASQRVAEQNRGKGAWPPKGVWQEKGTCLGTPVEQDDTDVDVEEEIDDVDFGIVAEDTEKTMQLDLFEPPELSIVRMDDIEAGLSRNEEVLVEVGRSKGVELSDLEEELEEYEHEADGGGLEEEGEADLSTSAELQRSLDEERNTDAVYDDVLLSSGNARLMSDSTDVPTVASAEPPSASSDSRAYSRGSRLRPEMPERRSIRLMNNDSYFGILSDGSSESDEEYSPQEDWKKETKVGDGYQATIPDYAPCTPFPSTATKARDLLMWSPRGTTEDKVSTYLGLLSEVVEGVPSDTSKDHETALQVLLACGHDIRAAWKSMQAESKPEGMRPWTEDECSRFEEGLRAVRKDFFNLQRKVRTRSVKEVVEFYYLWKKTERHDHFIQQYGKVGRKKAVIPPGHVSDFMDKYLDMHSSDAVDVHYMTSTVSVQAEMKKKESS